MANLNSNYHYDTQSVMADPPSFPDVRPGDLLRIFLYETYSSAKKPKLRKSQSFLITEIVDQDSRHQGRLRGNAFIFKGFCMSTQKTITYFIYHSADPHREGFQIIRDGEVIYAHNMPEEM